MPVDSQVEQVEAQITEAAWLLAEALEIVAKLVTEEVAEAGESSMATEESWTNEAAIDIDVAIEVADEERLTAAGGVMEEPTTSGVDAIVAASEEKLPAATEQKMVVKTDIPPP